MPCAILDAKPEQWGTEIQGVPVLGDDTLLKELICQGVECFVVGLGSTCDNRPREKLYELGLAYELKPVRIVHPGSICSSFVELGEGVQVLSGAIVNAGVRVGDNVIINSGAIIEHGCQIGDHVHVATGARLAGNVKIGSLAFVGAGAVVKQAVNIGTSAVVGAGSVVIQDVSPGATVVGCPARKIGQQKKK
jgi:UDP-perosamine 4-acetyltransferase